MKQLSLILCITLLASITLASELKPFQPKSGHKYCNPEVSKPCGNACISLAKQCRVPWTTSISGKRPATAKASFDAPRYVESAPQ
jgi:hypothetical protein